MYLTDFFNKNGLQKSGIVTLTVPDASGTKAPHVIRGLVNEDIAFKMSTKWGSVLPQMETLSDISQIMNQSNVMAWVSASASAWKGTDPFEFDITFYLVTYEYNQNPPIKIQAKWLAQLCSLYTDNKFATTTVHGGYKLHLEKSNKDLSASKYFGFNTKNYTASKVNELMNTNEGLVTMTLGNSMTINNLLVNNVTITPSSVQVEDNVPLYIKVDASFRTYRALITSDLDDMLGKSTGE